ncbi:MAG: hypothetical protein HYZ69_03545 [Candidatus Colwellbacteria bacterium]|nr:hypothetical protein [Candidatus Colwellbacteria bacterium]
MNSWPTRHVIRRVEIEGRCGLTADEICDLLDRNLDIPIGESKSRQVTHRLFYSQPDDEYFVAFQSEDGAVISVWPAKWHNRRKYSAWAISDQAKELARRAALLNQPLEPALDVPQKIFVNAIVRDSRYDKERQVRLGEYRSPAVIELQRWIVEPETQAMIRGWINSAGQPGYQVQVLKLLVKQGKRGVWLEFDLPVS